MGLFSKNKSEKSSKINWIAIHSLEELAQAFASSEDKASLFFKHSTRCSISKMALNRLEEDWEETDKINLYFIDLLNHRDVSNAISEKTGVEHQSPQAIVYFKGGVLYNASHNGISAKEIQNLV